jgi:hypothetical protein
MRRHPAADVLHAVLFDRAAHELVVVLARRADVHVEDVGLAAVHLVLVEHGVLGGVHAADLRAVGHALGAVAAARAGHEHDGLGLLAVAGALHGATGGARRRGQALELHAVDDVLVLAVAVLGELVGAA